MLAAPPDGTFAMRFSLTPQPLADLWVPDELTPLTTGAIMAFKSMHKMKPDASTDQAFWTALLSDVATDRFDPAPYSWAWTTMTRPETLQIWVDGTFVLSTAANTGIAAAPTPRGSWPVYARYRSQTMSGTNPNGTHYRDPGVPTSATSTVATRSTDSCAGLMADRRAWAVSNFRTTRRPRSGS